MDDPMSDFSTPTTAQTSANQRQLDLEYEGSVHPSDAIRRKYNFFNLQLYVEMGEQRVQNDSHKKRLQSLRKELDHLKATEWQYEPIEKHIGQA